MAIHFFCDDVTYHLSHKNALKSWALHCVQTEGKVVDQIHIILCSDEKLLGINQEFLQHDFYTDIITFDYGVDNTINGELYISLDRVKANAKSLATTVDLELYRVVIHGIMHLCGYKDKTKKDKILMTQKENFCLEKINQFIKK